MSIKKEVIDELHKPARVKFKRRRTIVRGLNDLFQTDLIEMVPYAPVNKGYRYILMVIDVFSKKLWARPIKRKTAEEVTKSMREILAETGPIKLLQSDDGREYFNRQFSELMTEFKIKHYSTFSSIKASVVERCNRTIKNLLWKQFSLQGNFKWVDILQDIVSRYNNTVHSKTGFKPAQVTKRVEKKILKHAFSHPKTIDPRKPKFAVGDSVRISKHRSIFRKGYLPSWTNEIFKIRQVLFTLPRTYLLSDDRKNNIQGGFYEEELQKVKHPDVYLVEKVLRRRKDMVYIKWLGLDNSHNTWIHKSAIV